jgi:hypothetical protein
MNEAPFNHAKYEGFSFSSNFSSESSGVNNENKKFIHKIMKLEYTNTDIFKKECKDEILLYAKDKHIEAINIEDENKNNCKS